MNHPTDNDSNPGNPDEPSGNAPNRETGVRPGPGAAIPNDREGMQDGMCKPDEVAAYLERQLIVQAAEIASLKEELTEMTSKFRKVQESNVALRKERHDLANKAMGVVDLQIVLRKVVGERDRAIEERDRTLKALNEATEAARKRN